jgi:hypothetical protein
LKRIRLRELAGSSMSLRFEIEYDKETGHYYITFINCNNGLEIDHDYTMEVKRIPLIIERMMKEYDWK